MTELIEFLVRALVEDPEAVVVEELEEDGDLVYEVTRRRGRPRPRDRQRRPGRERDQDDRQGGGGADRSTGHRRHPRLSP